MLALTLALALPSVSARAQSVDLCVHEMSDEQIDAHTQLIVGALRDHRQHVRLWRFGWLAAYTGIAVGATTTGATGAATGGVTGVSTFFSSVFPLISSWTC